MFFEDYECNVANYIDDNTPYVGEANLNTVLSKLETQLKKLFQLSLGNHMIAKSDKYHFLLTGEYQTNISRNGEYIIDIKNRFLGIKCASQLTFTTYISNLCKKTTKKQKDKPKVTALAGIDLDARRCLMKSFITSQFKHGSFKWMFQSLKVNNFFNKMHERAFRFRFNDSKS